ncbi:MAG: PAS domain S-box protein [Flavobacteriales bacterium]|nr:PAS domain S-box protein [Flavobacteriales bacterium]
MKEPEMLTIPETASLLHVHPNTIRAWMRKGKLVAVKMGKEEVDMFHKADVQKLIKPLEKQGAIVKEDLQAFPVVGIGASAGGMDAMGKLLSKLPTDLGLAYIFVTHMEDDREEMVVELLQKKTALPVVISENGARLKPDQLYVAAAGMHVSVVNNSITLQRPGNLPQAMIRPIDALFRGLANEYQNNAIGILLSGGGMDGTQGLRAIKAEDGLAIVQDGSALDPAMPRNAQEAGVVDLVLAPEAIGPQLTELVERLFPSGDTRLPAKHENELHRILRLMRELRGVDFTQYKETTIHRRIIRRMVLSKCTKLSDYLKLLREVPAEVDTLFTELLINVTSFFRDPDFHKALNEHVFPELFKDRAGNDTLRIWIPACAGGEEVVSVAIDLLEFLRKQSITTTVQIFATDLNERNIDKARLGIYKKTALQDIEPERLRQFFQPVDGHYQVIKSIRDMCVFAKHDLLKDPPFSRVDLISCQNMLIYMENASQGRILKNFHYALTPNGFLALGKSETVANAPDLFVQPERGHKVFQKKNAGAATIPLDLNFKPSLLQPLSTMVPNGPRPAVNSVELERDLEHVLLERHVPASVLVNKHFEIVRFMGPASKYILPRSGRATLNLLKMVREDLVFEVRTLLQRARRDKSSAQKAGIPVKFNNVLYDLTIEVEPIGGIRDPHFLVVFKDQVAAAFEPIDKDALKSKQRDARDKRIAMLERDLRDAREQLRIISEESELGTQELQAANEEVVSSNEELQSINEELETSKEELQSINEEYATINEELRLRNDSLKESQDRLELATRTGKVGIWDWDIVADHITWSESHYALHGVKPGIFEPTVKGFAELVHPEDRDRIVAAIDAALKHNAKYELEFRSVRPDGKVIWLFSNASVIRANGKPVRMLGATLDITDLKVAESALQERTRALEVMNTVGASLIAEVDTETIIQAVTDAARLVSGAEFGAFFHNRIDEKGESYMLYTLSGVPHEAFEKFPMPRATQLFGPTFRGEGVIRIDDVRKDPRYGKMAPHYGMPKGHLPVCSYLAVPVVSRNGQVLGGLFFGHKEPGRFNKEGEEMVTTLASQAAMALDNAGLHDALQKELEQQRIAEVALRESEQRYRELLTSLPAAVFACDAEGHLGVYNEAAVQLWGRQPETDERWTGALGLFDKDGHAIAKAQSPIARAIGEEKSIRDEVIIARPDGSRRNAMAYAEPMRDASGKVIGGHCVLIDITERKEAEAEREQLSGMLERSLNEIFIFDLDSLNFEYVNHGALRNLGYTLEQMRSMTPLDIKPGMNARQFDEIVKPLRKGEEEMIEFYTVHRRADGSDYPVEVHLQVLQNGPKRLFMAMILDITERKLDEERMLDLGARLDLALDSADLGTWNIDGKVEQMTTDGRFKSIFGWQEDTISVAQAFGVLHPDDRERVSAAIAGATRPEDTVPYEIEYRVIHPDGSIHWVLAKGRSTFTVGAAGKELLSFDGTVLDITERKASDAAERRLAAIVESSEDAIIGVDLEGVISDWNDGAEILFGYAEEEVIGRSITVLLPDDRKEEESNLLTRIANGERVEHFETKRQRKNGSLVDVALSISAIKDELGVVVGAAKIARDITIAKRAEEELRTSEQRFHLLADNVSQLIWMAEADGSNIWFNKRWYEFTGMTNEEIQANPKALYHPDHFARATTSMYERMGKGEQWDDVYPLKGKDGKYHWFLANAMPVKDGDGTVLRWFGTCTDITDQRLAQEKMRESEERFRLLADNIAQLAWIAEPNGDIHWYNKRWFDYSGTTPEEMDGWGWTKIHHPDHVERVTEKFKKHIQEERDWEDTFPIRGADGQYRWFLSRAFPVRDGQGVVQRWFGTNTDVTKEREARRLLQESEERMRLLAENMSQMAYIASTDMKIQWVNKRWLDYTGLDAQDMNNGGWERAVHPEDLSKITATFAEAISSKRPWEHVFKLKNKEGEYRWFLSISVPIINEKGEIEKWFGTNTDITDRKAVEEELATIATNKDNFLATLAHELRGPLAPLKNGLQLMEMATDDPAVQENTRGMMVRQLDHMVRLVDDLMDLSRINTGKFKLNMDEVDISDVVATAMEASRPEIDRNGHTLSVDVSSEMLLVKGDRDRLVQVVSNLLNNAAKYTPEKGRISVVVEHRANDVLIRVKDNGIGIAPEHINNVFDMFAQVDMQQKSRSGGGLGIGLNIVQRMMENHNGSVHAYSEGLGKGSEFTLRIPRMTDKIVPAAIPVNTVSEQGAKRRVLIVDDNEDAALSMSMILKKRGHTVNVAHDGQAAVAAGAEFKPELVIMDIGMPKMNGYEACAAMRNTNWGKNCLIFALSGWGQEEDRQKSKEAGFDRHVVKPIDRATLEWIVLQEKG